MAQSNPLKPTTSATNPGTTPAQGSTGQQSQNQLSPSLEQIMQICPDASKRDVAKYWPYVAKAMAEKGLTSKNQVIAALATLSAETTSFAPIKEAGGPFRYDPYRGRGFIQITWVSNYTKVSQYLGLGDQLVRNPDMAMEPELAAKIFIWYWTVGTTYNVGKYAEAGDFANVRSIVNRGHPGKIGSTTQSGTTKFFKVVERAKQVLSGGIDPNSVSNIQLPAGYGLGCVDTGSGGSRVLNGLNPNSQLDALIYALGIHNLDRQKAYIFHAELDVASQPEILKLQAQSTVEVKGFGAELDGTYTVDEIIFFFGKTLTAEISAYKADPNAPAPQVFLHDPSGQPLPSQLIGANGSIPTGDIPARIFAAGKAAKGSSTADGPEGGNKACAFALNKFCLVPAGLKPIGEVAAGFGYPISVASVEASLKGGRGQLVPRASAVPGDIWIMGSSHVGICTSAGCATVLSNSSSKAKFAWEDNIEKVNSFYGGTERIYRVTS